MFPDLRLVASCRNILGEPSSTLALVTKHMLGVFPVWTLWVLLVVGGLTLWVFLAGGTGPWPAGCQALSQVAAAGPWAVLDSGKAIVWSRGSKEG